MLDGVEFGEAAEHDDGTRFSIVSGPAAEAREDPGSEGERPFGMRILLPCGLAFEAQANAFEDRLIVGVEGAARAGGAAVRRARPPAA